jgi:hypothetical protein
MRRYSVGAALVAVMFAAALYYWRTYPHNESSAVVAVPTRPVETIPPQAPEVIPADVPTVVVEELAQLKPGITVIEWRRLHPADDWHKPTYEDQVSNRDYSLGNFCMVATLTRPLPMLKNLARKAVFYLPAPPTSTALPSGPPSSLTDTCVLGYVATTLETESNEAKAGLDREVSATLSSRYGQPINGRSPVNGRSIIRIWSTGDVKTAVGDLLFEGPTKTFTANSYLPVFRYERLEFPDVEYGSIYPGRGGDTDIFDLAMRTANMDVAVTQPVATMYQKWLEFAHLKEAKFYWEQPEVPRPLGAKDVAAVLGPWLQSATELAPRRRAAALLAADLILEVAWEQFSTTGKKTEQEKKDLEGVGAVFVETIGGTVPSVKWIQQARELDPDGPIGDAVMIMTVSGWNLRQLYSGGYEELTDYLIAGGEKYRSRPQNPNLAAWAEFFIASAYCDQVVISYAGNTDNPSVEPGPYLTEPTESEKTRGVAAKPEAIKHIQSLLAMDRTSRRAIAAWRMAWRLIAELPLDRHYGIAGDA